jgi:hypothetical protein
MGAPKWLPDGCELGDRTAMRWRTVRSCGPVFEETRAEGGPDEWAGGEGAGQGEAECRRVEHGQGRRR